MLLARDRAADPCRGPPARVPARRGRRAEAPDSRDPATTSTRGGLPGLQPGRRPRGPRASARQDAGGRSRHALVRPDVHVLGASRPGLDPDPRGPAGRGGSVRRLRVVPVARQRDVAVSRGRGDRDPPLPQRLGVRLGGRHDGSHPRRQGPVRRRGHDGGGDPGDRGCFCEGVGRGGRAGRQGPGDRRLPCSPGGRDPCWVSRGTS